MDTKIGIKEEDSLSDDIVSQNERESFTKNATMKINSDYVLLDEHCDVTIKTEIKSETESETGFPDFCSQKEEPECFNKRFIKQIKFETVTCNNNYEIDTNIEIGSQKEDPVTKVMKYNSNCEMENKMEIEVDSWWLDAETSKDRDCTPVKSPRYTGAVSGDRCDDSSLPSAEALEKNISFKYEKNCPEYKSPSEEKHVHSEQYGACNDEENIYNRASLIHKSKRPHKCNVCDKSFTRSSDLKLHNLIHEGKKPHKCEICAKSFTLLKNLKRHNLIHVSKKLHSCEICEKSFTYLSELKLHNLIHEGKEPHKCEVCSKSFTYLADLKRHNLLHDGKKPHQCKICEKQFTLLSHLKRHNLMHEKKPHKCEICKKRFTDLSSLKLHNLIHEDKKSHTCEICEKSFTYLSGLKMHKLVHKGLKPYTCKICEKSFTYSSSLKRHILIHEGKRSHKCEICGKKFLRLSYLKSHNLLHEGTKLQHICQI